MTYAPLDHPLLHRVRDQVLFAAGPIGSSVLALNLEDSAFVANSGTEKQETHDGCPEWLNVSSPEILESIFASFYEAGCDAVDSASFGANDVVLAEFGLADRTRELNRIAAEVIGRVRDRFSTPEWPRYAFGTIGPGTKLPSLGHITWDELVPSYRKQALGLLEGGIDVLKVETCQDLLQLKAAVAGCVEAMEEAGQRIPLLASVTIESTGTMLLGSDIASALTALEAIDAIDIIGINCATGPTEMLEHVRYLTENSRRPVFIGPNAGLPEVVDGQACYSLPPDEFARYHRVFVDEFGINIAAGCCGTTPEMLAAAIKAVGRRAPKQRPSAAFFMGASATELVLEPSVSSIYTSTPIRQETSFLVVGERINATGSKAFRDLLIADDLDGIVALARDQASQGAHVLDVMVDHVGRDGVRDVERIGGALRTQSTLPLMFDSTEVPVIEAALKLYGGKAIVNSINLEDGEKKITRLLPLIKRHGAAAVALTIDEEGQARTVEWKVQVARRIHDLAVDRFGMEPSDLLIDCLTFPLSTGQEETRRDGIATLEALRQVKSELPGVHTILGVSNCSFGLRPPARRVLNSVFLHEAVQNGLDAAIVNARQIVPLSRIPDEQVAVARDLIYDRRADDYDPLHKFISLFDDEKTRVGETKDARALLSVEDRLKARIIEGDRRGLDDDLDEALGVHDPLVIINRYLLDGMKAVGDLFGSGKMQLPFVLQSAETMKAAVDHLEPHMEREEGQSKGSIVLATVRGDVHDIGKNLVDIILSNNGYTVHNLGIKQPIASVIAKAEEVNADAIGLSGLLVKSTVVMREDLEELNTRELTHYPVLLGGAALNRRYVEDELRAVYQGSVYYCKDAFEGLATMDKLAEGQDSPSAAGSRAPIVQADEAGDDPSNAYVANAIRTGPRPSAPQPPFWGSRLVKGLPLTEIFPFINEIALFRGQWQYQRGELSGEEYEALLSDEVRPALRSLQESAIAEALLEPQVVYGYFPALAAGNELLVWPSSDGSQATGEPVRFRFPRQPDGKRLCIADFFLSAEEAGWDPQSSSPPSAYDTVSFHVVTVGAKATDHAQELFKANRYREYLHFHGFAVETAEALAEFWHKRIREELGIASADASEVRQLFQQAYTGSRYSFGYPACPDLEEQVGIAALLDPSRIGCDLSETFQWHPEQTTSAIVVHHPEAKYFTIR